MRLDVNPGAEQARRWLEEELAKDEYNDGRSLLERVLRWIGEQLTRAESTTEAGTSLSAHPVVIALVVAVLIAILVLLLTRVRGQRRAAEASDRGLGALALSAPQFRDLAATALREGRWNDAVINYTRAVARDASDRTLLSDAPSLTAHEVGARLSAVFPSHGPALHRTMDLFDAVRYGRYAAAAPDAEQARSTCQALRDARPDLTAAPPSAKQSASAARAVVAHEFAAQERAPR